MNFRILRPITYVIALVTTLTGCTDFMHGKAEKKETLKIELVDGSCSKDFKQQLTKMGNSEASEIEINAVFECVDKYMATFQNKVEGEARPDVYDAQDLLYVTNRFFKDLELSKDVIKKITNFKRAMVGGDAESVTRQEITDIREFFKKYLQPEVVLLAPHFKYLKLNTGVTSVAPAEKEISAAVEQVRKSLKLLISKANVVRSGYSYNDLKELLLGIELVDSSDKHVVETIDKTRKLLIGNEELKTVDDLLIFIDNAVDAYSLYLNSCHGQVKFEISSLENVRKVIGFFDRISNLLSSSYQFKKTGQLSTHDLDEVLEVLMEKKIFPFDVKFATFQDFYKVALKRVFSQETSDFMTAKQFLAYRKESELFKLEITYLETLDAKKMYKTSDLRQSAKLYGEKKSYYAIPTTLSNPDRYKLATDWIDMNVDLYNGYPAMIKNKKYLIMTELSTQDFSILDLARGFYIKMLGRQLLMGWGSGKTAPQFNKSTLTKDQMVTFSREFKQFGIELKLNDPRAKGDGSKSFLEANLFGFTSDGNSVMSMPETIEYMHYLVAEGASTTQEIQQDLANAKCELPQLDVFGNHWNPEACFIQNLKRNYSKYFAGKPGLVKYLSKLSDKDFMDYYSLMMSFARFDVKNKNIAIETADIQTFVVVTSYIESMFVKYDVNQSGTLSPGEIRSSYPKFKTFATDYSEKHAADSMKEWDAFYNICKISYTKEDLVRESFIFMVLNQGKKPVKDDMNYLRCNDKGLFTFKNEIDRKTIVYTFLVLKDVLASAK